MIDGEILSDYIIWLQDPQILQIFIMVRLWNPYFVPYFC